LDAKGQDSSQLDLLQEAYEKNSSELLFDFFDHWSTETQSHQRFQGDDNRLKEWIEVVKNPDNDYGPFSI